MVLEILRCAMRGGGINKGEWEKERKREREKGDRGEERGGGKEAGNGGGVKHICKYLREKESRRTKKRFSTDGAQNIIEQVYWKDIYSRKSQISDIVNDFEILEQYILISLIN